MTIVVNGLPVTDVDLVIEALLLAGAHVPAREWIQWHLDHDTPLETILYACGVFIPVPISKAS